jgi:hypothetical protein
MSNVGRQGMRHRSEIGALLEMQNHGALSVGPRASPHAAAANTKDSRSRALLQALGAAAANGLHRCSSGTPAHHRWNGPSVLRRLANRWASMNHVALASVRCAGHHGSAWSQYVALWHRFGTQARPSEGQHKVTCSAAPFAVTAMHVLSTMTPNPSVKPTRSGLRPPRAAYLKR